MRVKKPFWIAAVALLMLPGTVFGAKKWEKFKYTKLNEIQVPEVHRTTLDNGIELFVLEDQELPLFRMTLSMKVGDAHAPAHQVGLASLTSEVLRSGGSVKLGGDQLDELLESRGGSIETSTDDLTTTISVNVLVEDTERALEIVRDLLMSPAFPEDKIELAMKQFRSAISRRNDDPGSIADREINKILYGADHPFARQMEYEHLENIGRADLVAFHSKYYQAGDTYVAVWGNFNRDHIVATVNNILGAWPKKTVQYPTIPEVREVSSSVNLIVKESVTQSNIRMGHRSVKVDHPDYHTLVVMNELLGGGIGARLFNQVRSLQGLAYRVGSRLGADLARPGMFQVICGTKSETTVKAAEACLAEVRRMRDEPVTEEELARAKDGLLNSYVFRFANKGAIVNRQMRYVRNGYPANFLESFPAKVAAVTIEDVQRAASEFLKPDNMGLLVVGKPDDFDAELTALGTPVNEIDITIPEPPTSAFPEPTAETLQQGRALLASAAKAHGGTDALKKVTSITEPLSFKLNAMGMSMDGSGTRYVQLPSSIRMEVKVMGTDMIQMYNGEARTGFIQGPMGSQDLTDSQIKEFEGGLARELIVFLRDYENYSPQFLGEGKVDGAAADIVLMTPPGGHDKFKVFLDRSSHLVTKLEYRGTDMQGTPVNTEEFLKNYKTVAGVKLPHASTQLNDGEPFMDGQSTGISLNDAIPAAKFAKAES